MAERIATIYDYARFMRNYCVNTRCHSCQFSIQNNETNTPCRGFVRNYPDKANGIILAWCDEHPKTYKDVFLEKFPNAKMNKEIPSVCRDYVYGIQKECGNKKCEDCWNEVIPE